MEDTLLLLYKASTYVDIEKLIGSSQIQAFCDGHISLSVSLLLHPIEIELRGTTLQLMWDRDTGGSGFKDGGQGYQLEDVAFRWSRVQQLEAEKDIEEEKKAERLAEQTIAVVTKAFGYDTAKGETDDVGATKK